GWHTHCRALPCPSDAIDDGPDDSGIGCLSSHPDRRLEGLRDRIRWHLDKPIQTIDQQDIERYKAIAQSTNGAISRQEFDIRALNQPRREQAARCPLCG
ncbi:MAG: hypothetical protein NTX51_16130, partial [Verrucomicrobia bacterium]|nr:hypothetical protein [Verrucomicrobiota bacterium]